MAALLTGTVTFRFNDIETTIAAKTTPGGGCVLLRGAEPVTPQSSSSA